MEKRKYKILITNDDGASCPLFHSFVKKISKEDFCSDILIVVPAFEQSWISNAITRDKEILHSKEVYGEFEYNIIDGTPADCTAIGLCHIADKKWSKVDNKISAVDMVISGINMGTNAGDSFSQSSGTIAAVKTASLFGIKGIACSATLPSEIRKAWIERDFDYLNQVESNLTEITDYHVRCIRSVLNSNIFETKSIDYLSINSPIKINKESPPIICKTKKNLFSKMFIEVRENIYSHKFSGFIDKEEGREELRDLDLLEQGYATISHFSSSLSEDLTLKESEVEILQSYINNNF